MGVVKGGETDVSPLWNESIDYNPPSRASEVTHTSMVWAREGGGLV